MSPSLLLPLVRLLCLLFPPASSQDVDDDVSPRGTNMRPQKRRVVDGGASIPAVVDLSEAFLEAEVKDVATTLVMEDVGVTLDDNDDPLF